MAPNVIYVLHPCVERWPPVLEWIADVESIVSCDAAWLGWTIQWVQTDKRGDFRADDLIRLVELNRGPILQFGETNAKPAAIIRQELQRRCVIELVSPTDSTALWAAMCDLRDKHLDGLPRLPRRLVAAVLIVRKLVKHDYWGGSHEKNFLYADDLAKGRGVDESFSDIAREVANTLAQHSILIGKYGGNGKRQKYALNISQKAAIDRIVATTEFPDALERIFSRDRTVVKADLVNWTPLRG